MIALSGDYNIICYYFKFISKEKSFNHIWKMILGEAQKIIILQCLSDFFIYLSYNVKLFEFNNSILMQVL